MKPTVIGRLLEAFPTAVVLKTSLRFASLLTTYSLFQIYKVHPKNRVSLQFSHHY